MIVSVEAVRRRRWPESADRRCSENRAYLVGGSVRDILIGRPPNDFDIVTEKDVSGVAAAVAKAFDTSVISYGRFMTHKVRIRQREYDFAAARLEYYDFPGSLPTVAPASLMKDLLRTGLHRECSCYVAVQRAISARWSTPPAG